MIENLDDKIYGGEATTIEQHPHQISLRKDNYHLCGGAIISPIRALTSAYCVYYDHPVSRFLVRVGTTLNNVTDGQARQLSRIMKHELLDDPYLSNNIAILFWEEPLTLGANVQAIRLPAANAPVPYGQNATFTGYGDTDTGVYATLREVTKSLISDEVCKVPYPNYIRPGVFCTEGGVGRGGTEVTNKYISVSLRRDRETVSIFSNFYFQHASLMLVAHWFIKIP